MLALLRRLPTAVLVVAGIALLALFVATLARGGIGRPAGWVALACLAIVGLRLHQRWQRRGRGNHSP